MTKRREMLDALNASLKAAEARLYDLNLGVPGRVPLGDQANTHLVWAKVDSKWGLHITVIGTQLVTSRLLMEATVDHKVLAANALDKLLVVIQAALNEDCRGIVAATAAADAAFLSIKNVRPT